MEIHARSNLEFKQWKVQHVQLELVLGPWGDPLFSAPPDEIRPLSSSLLPDDARVVLLPYGSSELCTDMDLPPVDRRGRFGDNFPGSTDDGSA